MTCEPANFAEAIESEQTNRITPYKDLSKPSKHSGPLPTVEFGSVSGETPAEQVRRQDRESRRRNFFPRLIADPGRFFNGERETVSIKIEEIVTIENPDPAYPASLCSAVVVGTVTGATAFVSQDRTYAYSDYRVKVDQVLKQDTEFKLTAGTRVTVSRPGATVIFPSGHVTHFVLLDRGHPKIGKQYLLFLWKLDPSFREYEILYGGSYELSHGRAYSLDDGFHYFRAPEDSNANLLLTKVMKAIALKHD
jgi:hypothetical protein